MPRTRTYRDRRDRYARSLEEELARVRASEANLLREVDRLRSTVQTLVQALGQQGLDAIDESDVDSPIGYAGLHGKNLVTLPVPLSLLRVRYSRV